MQWSKGGVAVEVSFVPRFMVGVRRKAGKKRVRWKIHLLLALVTVEHPQAGVGRLNQVNRDLDAVFDEVEGIRNDFADLRKEFQTLDAEDLQKAGETLSGVARFLSESDLIEEEGKPAEQLVELVTRLDRTMSKMAQIEKSSGEIIRRYDFIDSRLKALEKKERNPPKSFTRYTSDETPVQKRGAK